MLYQYSYESESCNQLTSRKVNTNLRRGQDKTKLNKQIHTAADEQSTE